MQTVRLWTAALVSRIDGMVSRIENHEALAASAIRDVRRAAARAKDEMKAKADASRTAQKSQERSGMPELGDDELDVSDIDE